MLRFPGEDQRLAALQEMFVSRFEFVDQFCDKWMQASADAEKWWPNLTLDVARAGMLLNMQAIRQFRSVIEECRRGESLCAQILSRSLFETLIAQNFVLSTEFGIVIEKWVDAQGQQRLDGDGKQMHRARLRRDTDDESRCATREVRANLYFAHTTLSNRRVFEKMSVSLEPTIATVGQSAVANLRDSDKVALVQYERIVGAEWMYVLAHHPFSYSGLKAPHLAEALGSPLHHWRNSVFALQSHAVHGADAQSVVGATENGSVGPIYFSTDEEVDRALMSSVYNFGMCADCAQRYVGFGDEVETMLQQALIEFEQVF